VDAETLAKRLAAVGSRRAQLIHDRRQVTAELAALVPRAYAAGIGVTEMTRLTGMSSRSIYDILNAVDK
jgi:hypothetical protein